MAQHEAEFKTILMTSRDDDGNPARSILCCGTVHFDASVFFDQDEIEHMKQGAGFVASSVIDGELVYFVPAVVCAVANPNLEKRIDEAANSILRSALAKSGWVADIKEWAESRNLLEKSTPLDQIRKLREEVEELEQAIISGCKREISLEAGDVQVVVSVICSMLGLNSDLCRERTLGKIVSRTGEIKDGVFVKDEKANA